MKKKDNNSIIEDLKSTRLLIMSGVISFFTILSTEMVLNILPLFTVAIGGTPFILGIIAGTSSLVLYILYGIWNWLNSQFSRKKTVLLLGGILSNASKPLISFSPSWQFVLGLKTTECLGNNIRASSCDDIFECNCQPEFVKFRIDKILESLGIVIGSFLAFFFLLIKWSFSQIIFFSIIPGIVAIILIIIMRSNLEHSHPPKKNTDVEQTDSKHNFKRKVIMVGLVELASLDALFLVLRSIDFVSNEMIFFIPLFFLISNVIYLAFSENTRKVSNLKKQKTYLSIGLILLIFLSISLVFPIKISVYSTILISFVFLLYGSFKALTIPISNSLKNQLLSGVVNKKSWNKNFIIIGILAFVKSMVFGLIYMIFSFTILFITISIFIAFCLLTLVFMSD